MELIHGSGDKQPLDVESLNVDMGLLRWWKSEMEAAMTQLEKKRICFQIQKTMGLSTEG